MIRMAKATTYNGTAYCVGDECRECAATQKRWIANGIAEKSSDDLFDEPRQSKYDGMTNEQIEEYAKQIGVDIRRCRSRDAAIAKIRKAE